MGFHAIADEFAAEEAHLENAPPPSKNRVWGFFTTSETCAGFFESQPVEPHRENQPTPTKTVSGVRYYGLRFYMPEIGRWSAVDKQQELGGLNLFGFVNNAPVNECDMLGMMGCSWFYEYSGSYSDLTVTNTDAQPPIVFVAGGMMRPSINLAYGDYYIWPMGKFTGYCPSCELEIIIRHDLSPSQPTSNGTGRNLLQHEEMHARFAERMYDSIDAEIQPRVDHWMCWPCFMATGDYLSKMDAYYRALRASWDASLDCQDYPGSMSGTGLRARRCGFAAQKRTEVTRLQGEMSAAAAVMHTKCP